MDNLKKLLTTPRGCNPNDYTNNMTAYLWHHPWFKMPLQGSFKAKFKTCLGMTKNDNLFYVKIIYRAHILMMMNNAPNKAMSLHLLLLCWNPRKKSRNLSEKSDHPWITNATHSKVLPKKTITVHFFQNGQFGIKIRFLATFGVVIVSRPPGW